MTYFQQLTQKQVENQVTDNVRKGLDNTVSGVDSKVRYEVEKRVWQIRKKLYGQVRKEFNDIF
jgi:hypothetical protein